MNMDVTHFKPEEIEIRVEGIQIIIHGRHEEREDDHGLIEREFTRIYTLPKVSCVRYDCVWMCMFAYILLYEANMSKKFCVI